MATHDQTLRPPLLTLAAAQGDVLAAFAYAPLFAAVGDSRQRRQCSKRRRAVARSLCSIDVARAQAA